MCHQRVELEENVQVRGCFGVELTMYFDI